MTTTTRPVQREAGKNEQRNQRVQLLAIIGAAIVEATAICLAIFN